MRQAAEDSVRELRQVLLETALRLDGNRLEEMRRNDPGVPVRWLPADWRKFLASASMPVGWNDSKAWESQKREFAQQIEALKASLAAMERSLEEERSRRNAEPPASPAPVPAPEAAPTMVIAEGMTPPLDVLIEQVRKVLDGAPNRPPIAFSKILDGGSRTGGDRMRIWPRYWAIIYLLGSCQISAAMEVEQALAGLFKVSAGAGSMRRALGDLLDCSLVDGKIILISSPRSALKVLRLTEDGGRLFQEVFAQTPVENDWSRMIRLHEGDRFEEHTLAVLAFAMHARRRGWATQILPEASGNARPDVCVANAQSRYYVEVELSRKENAAKWRNLAELNGGAAALCAGTTDGRKRLVSDCKLLKLPGVATDLEALVATPYKTAQDSPLWTENW